MADRLERTGGRNDVAPLTLRQLGLAFEEHVGIVAFDTRDALLKLVPPARRGTLIDKQKGKGALEWNVILQGKNETLFFDF